jgi:hypothetical protein
MSNAACSCPSHAEFYLSAHYQLDGRPIFQARAKAANIVAFVNQRGYGGPTLDIRDRRVGALTVTEVTTRRSMTRSGESKRSFRFWFQLFELNGSNAAVDRTVGMSFQSLDLNGIGA